MFLSFGEGPLTEYSCILAKQTFGVPTDLSQQNSASVFTACGSDSVGEGSVTQGESISDADAESVDTVELTELEKRQRISDNLPEKDWEGKEFRILLSDRFDAQYVAF